MSWNRSAPGAPPSPAQVARALHVQSATTLQRWHAPREELLERLV